MAPTTDALLDFVGRGDQRHAAAMTSSSPLGAVAYDPKVVTIWDGFRVWLAEHDLPSTTCCIPTTSDRSRT